MVMATAMEETAITVGPVTKTLDVLT